MCGSRIFQEAHLFSGQIFLAGLFKGIAVLTMSWLSLETSSSSSPENWSESLSSLCSVTSVPLLGTHRKGSSSAFNLFFF